MKINEIIKALRDAQARQDTNMTAKTARTEN